MNNIGVIYDLQHHLLLRRAVTTPFRSSLSNRGEIKSFSESSGARMRRYLRNCEADYTVMLTLTYPEAFSNDGRECKRHLKVFLQRIKRKACQQSGFDEKSWSAFWFLEFQERGAPHFHIFLTHGVPKEYVSTIWYEIVGSKDEKHLAAGTRIEKIRSGRYGTCAYASKYAAKAEQKEVPALFVDCGRFWGIAGLRRTVAATIFVPLDLLENETFLAFRRELKKILAKGRPGLRQTHLRGLSSGLFITKNSLRVEIKNLFVTFGPLLEQVGCAYTSPEREELSRDILTMIALDDLLK